MSRCLFELLGRSWTPRVCTEDPVAWQRREQNQIADFLVNCAMDRREGFHKDFDPLPGFCFHLSNFSCHSDGGTRSEICSAAAWHGNCHDKLSGYNLPVGNAGSFSRTPVSSFLAEPLALEDAIVSFAQLLPNRSVDSKHISSPAL